MTGTLGTTSQDPALLFSRACTVQVGDLKIQTGPGIGLDLVFTVRRGVKVTQGATKPQPNTCDLDVWGLSDTHRRELESVTPGPGASVVPVSISAGYLGRQSVIFSGEMRAAHSMLDDNDEMVTRLTTGDGDDALTQTRLTVALAPGANATQGLTSILKALGVGAGNIASTAQRLAQQALAAQLFSRGVVFKGAAAEIMTDFCRSVGLDWSIQNGTLQLTSLGQPMQGRAILIDSSHGMIGSPTVDTKGILTVRTDMVPDVFPGVALSMNATNIQGGYRVLSVETKGDTAGEDWGHEIEAARY